MVNRMEDLISFILKKEVIGTALTILFSFIMYKMLKFLIEHSLTKAKNEYERKKKRTVTELLKNILKVLIVAIAIICILDLYGVNVNSLVASLGIASAVGALALQDTLKDVICGAVIIMDNYFVMGDYIKYEGFTGQVIEFGLKTTKIMNVDGEVKIVANRNISEVINLSQKKASNLILAPVAYEEKIEKVEKILNEIVEEIRTWETMDIKETNYIGVVELNASSVDYGIRIYCSPGKVWQYRRDVLRLIKIKFDKNKIKIPYNQLEVHNANTK